MNSASHPSQFCPRYTSPSLNISDWTITGLWRDSDVKILQILENIDISVLSSSVTLLWDTVWLILIRHWSAVPKFITLLRTGFTFQCTSFEISRRPADFWLMVQNSRQYDETRSYALSPRGSEVVDGLIFLAENVDWLLSNSSFLLGTNIKPSRNTCQTKIVIEILLCLILYEIDEYFWLYSYVMREMRKYKFFMFVRITCIVWCHYIQILSLPTLKSPRWGWDSISRLQLWSPAP